MKTSVLSIFSRNIGSFKEKIELQKYQSLRFSEINSNSVVPDVTQPPPAPTASMIFKLYEKDANLREAYDRLINDAQALSSAEFGVEAFVAQRDKWETQLRDVEEDICMQSTEERELMLNYVVSQLHAATKREDRSSYLLSQLRSILSTQRGDPLLEMLNFVYFYRQNPGSSGVQFLYRCFQSELKATARYTSTGSRIDVQTSRLNSVVSFQTDANSTGRTLRTRQPAEDSTLMLDGYSLYGRIYNCVKCGYTVEIIDLMDQNKQIDYDLKLCIEELLENDYLKSVRLESYKPEHTDPYYHLLAYMFIPYAPDQTVTPAFLDQVYAYLISYNTCPGAEIDYIQARQSRSCIKALILLLQGRVSECLMLLFQSSLFVELFTIALFLYNELCDAFLVPKTLESAGNDVILEILNKKRDMPSTALVLTRFLDTLYAKQPNLVTYTKADLIESLTLFDLPDLRVSVFVAQAYLALLRGSGCKDLNAYQSHFLAKFQLYRGDSVKAVQAVIYSVYKDAKAEIANGQLFYNVLVEYLNSALAAAQLDAVRLADVVEYYEQYEKYGGFQDFECQNIRFMLSLLEVKMQLIKGQFSAEQFNRLQFKQVNSQFFALVKDSVISSVFWILGQFQKYGIKFDHDKVKEATTLFHSLRLLPEQERVVAEIDTLLQ